jgi:hypothetical protein
VSQGGAAMAFQDQTAYGAAIDALKGNPQLRSQAERLGAQLRGHVPVDLRTFLQIELDRSLS